MQTEITSNVDINGTEKKGLTLNRVRVEESKTELDQMTDYPSGIVIGD